ncbi:hypothetical protein MXB_4379, partial [Myxobolus squamalis]
DEEPDELKFEDTRKIGQNKDENTKKTNDRSKYKMKTKKKNVLDSISQFKPKKILKAQANEVTIHVKWSEETGQIISGSIPNPKNTKSAAVAKKLFNKLLYGKRLKRLQKPF